MRVNNESSEGIVVKWNAETGMFHLPDLFLLYKELIMKQIEHEPEVDIGGRSIKFSDDAVTIANTTQALQEGETRNVDRQGGKVMAMNTSDIE